ncbi:MULTISPECIES: hypothetical protein [Dyella]|uniref:Uncharacterized protein n=2 Tax=Dyella TaxID=231454 RepID=A0A4R0YUP0_9GAMM|nr:MULTISPECIES: hypothetical protein [Dyella]TBR40237.1 hypothetical protein EYV96_08745 [Dyella terrae]TCI12181.1 hypothetical protein EZM97_02125 [Dyella soli]
MTLNEWLAALMFGLFFIIVAMTLTYFFKLHQLSNRLGSESPETMRQIQRDSVMKMSNLRVAYKVMIEPVHAASRATLSADTLRAVHSTKRLLYVTASLFMIQLFVGLYLSLDK